MVSTDANYQRPSDRRETRKCRIDVFVEKYENPRVFATKVFQDEKMFLILENPTCIFSCGVRSIANRISLCKGKDATMDRWIIIIWGPFY